MRRAEWILAGALPVLLTGCVVRGKQAPNVASAPATPAPPVAVPPPPPPEPLSIPQTQAHLPEPQPISPEALATIQRPEQPAETQTAPQPPRRPTPAPAAGPPKPPEGAPVPAQIPPTPAPAEPERQPLQEIVPAPESKRLQEAAAARKQEVRKVLEQAQGRPVTREERNQISRIQSFLQLSDEAEKRNDMRQADALAQRAQILARELQNAGR